MISLPEFVTKYQGQFVHFDKVYGAQCMDLFRVYVDEVLGAKYQTPLVRNAAQVAYNYPTKYWRWIQNTPTNFPLPGDVVIWSIYYSRSLTGHIAICVTADVDRMTCFSQNDPGGEPAGLRDYGYSRVKGWLRPKAPICTSL